MYQSLHSLHYNELHSATSFYGGGLFIDGASPVVQGNVFTANQASGVDQTTNFLDGRGGGAAAIDSDANFLDNTFEANDAFFYGGGLYVEDHGGEVSGNTFHANEAFYGGGVDFHRDSTTDAFQNAFTENVSVDWGGGVLIYDANGVEFTNNLLDANTAGEGGALYIFSSGPVVVNNTMVDNHATEIGEVGGMRVWNGTIRNNLVVGGTGYGIEIGSTNFIGVYQYNDVFDWSLGTYLTADLTGANGNTSVDPLFVALSQDVDSSNDDLSLQVGSPGIDAGNPAGIFDDPDGTDNDLGAYGGPGGGW